MDEHTAYEQAYRNGKEYMRSAILDKLRSAKEKAMGIQRFFFDEIIRMVERLEVRP